MRRLWKAGELFLCALQGRRVDLVVSGTMTDFPATLELDPLFLQVEPPTLYLLQLQTAATARGGGGSEACRIPLRSSRRDASIGAPQSAVGATVGEMHLSDRLFQKFN